MFVLTIIIDKGPYIGCVPEQFYNVEKSRRMQIQLYTHLVVITIVVLLKKQVGGGVLIGVRAEAQPILTHNTEKNKICRQHAGE